MVSGVRRLAHAAHARLFGSYQDRALNLLLLMFVVDYAERTLVGALGPTLKETFNIGNFRLGLLQAAFLFVAAAAAIPLGMLTDRTNRTRLVAACFAVWAVAVALVGTSATFVMFFVFRMLVGVVSAVSGPAYPSLTGDLVAASRRGEAMGRVNTGILIGLGLGYALPPVVTAVFPSWRWAFWLLAIAGVCLAVAFWRAKEPERTEAIGPEESTQREEEESQVWQMVRERDIEPSRTAMIRQIPSEMSMWEAAKYTVRVRTDLIALIARSIGDFFLASLATFAVVFVTGWYGLSQNTANLAILGVGIGALAGVLAEGRLSDALLRRRHLNGRIWVGASGYIIACVAFFPAFITHSLWIALPLFCVGFFFLAGARPPLDALRIDVLVPALRGRAESVRQVIRSIAEGMAPFVVGTLSTILVSGSGVKGVQLAFLIVLPALLLNGLILLIALRTYQSDVAAAIASSEQVRSSRQEQSSAGQEEDTDRS